MSQSDESQIKINTETAIDIFHSRPKFMIYMLLSIYSDLSLTQLSKMLKKRKSTISVHLKKMIEANLVEISKKVKVRGDKKAKYYRLIEDIDEKILLFTAADPEKMTPEELSWHHFNMHALFAEMNIAFLEKWLEFCKENMKDIEAGKYSTNPKDLELYEEEQVKFSIFSSYSIPVAKTLTTNIYKAFAKAETDSKQDRTEFETKTKDPEKKTSDVYIRPEFSSFFTIPIKKVFDYYMSKED